MSKMSSYVWCVVVGGIACFTMGFGIGANDVSNNFGTSIGSKAITLGKAVIIASIFEFLGSVCLGASVTDAVRNGVIYADKLADQPDLLMYGNLCALMTSCVFLLLASKYGLPVSTTHSMIGSLLGVGLGIGLDMVNWMYIVQVVVSWLLSPLLASLCGALYFFTVRSLILRKDNAVRIGKRFLWLLLLILAVVFMLFFQFSNPVILSGMSCEVDGEIQEDCNIKDWTYDHVGYAVGIACGFAVVFTLILAPVCYWKVNRNLKRFEVMEEAYKEGRLIDHLETGANNNSSSREEPRYFTTDNAIIAVPSSASSIRSVSTTVPENLTGGMTTAAAAGGGENGQQHQHLIPSNKNSIKGEFHTEFSVTPKRSTTTVISSSRSMTSGSSHDLRSRKYESSVLTSSSEVIKPSLWKRAYDHLPWNRDLHLEAMENDDAVKELNEAGERFEPKSETFFAVLQIISACVTCVVHGSNDVANATAPFANVYSIYENGEYLKEIAVPVWILALGGGAIGVGLTFLGHHVIQKVGIELVKMTPSRGFCMEMGMATVMVIGSFLGLPLSTTHCMIGSAVGVALLDPELNKEEREAVYQGEKSLPLCSKPNWRAINWKLMAKIGTGWILTLVVTAATSCALFSFSIYGPTRVYSYYDYTYVSPSSPTS